MTGLLAALENVVREKVALHIDTNDIAKDPKIIEIAIQLGWPQKAFENYLRQRIAMIVRSWKDPKTKKRTHISIPSQPTLPAIPAVQTKKKRHYEADIEVMHNPLGRKIALEQLFGQIRGLITNSPLLTDQTELTLLNCVEEAEKYELQRIV
jgi:hypothetical protein